MQNPAQFDYVLLGGDRRAERLCLLAAVKWLPGIFQVWGTR